MCLVYKEPAETGQVDLAIRTAEAALGLEASNGSEALRNHIQERLTFYKNSQTPADPLRRDRDF